MPVQCVGAWVVRKHECIRLYIEATKAVRRKFIPPEGFGGAAFIDLFTGPGRARIRSQSHTIEGSPMIVLGHQEAPFTHVLLCDKDPENIAALRARTAPFGERVTLFEGDCNERIDEIVARIPPNGLNIALLDPFGPKGLRWSTLEKLGSLKRMDLLIHFPTGPIKRNFVGPRFGAVIDELLGTGEWRPTIHRAEQVPELIAILRRKLSTLGYDHEAVNSVSVCNDRGVLLYYLVFASKNERGTTIWSSITRHDGPQRGFAFP